MPSFKIIGRLVLKKRFLKVSAIYSHDGRLGRVTLTFCTNFHSSCQFKASTDIKGIEIAGIEYLLSQFPDDTTILLDGTENSLNETLKILNMFALASGFK